MSFFSSWAKKLTGQPEKAPPPPVPKVYEPEIQSFEREKTYLGPLDGVQAMPEIPSFESPVTTLDSEVKEPEKEELDIIPPENYTLDDLLNVLVDSGGSDLHLAVNSSPIVRVHGDLKRMKVDRITGEKIESILYPVMGYEQKEKYFKSGNLDFAYEISGVARFRANYFNQYHGMAGVFRIIPSKIPTIDQLKLPTVLKEISLYRSGMVIVTGPTGSGKSTTLAAMINHLNESRAAHIITIEDPLEFSHQNKKCIIDHREVGIHATSFADALRSSLREDPDIILVGEMRDLETIYQAVKAAETGVLVFATLHTNSAPKTVDRMIDVFPAKQQEQIRSMLSISLKAVVAQQLLKTFDGKGRCASNEILISMSGLGNLIREGKTSMIPSFIQTGREHGMQSMDQSLINLLKQKKITVKAAKEKAHDYNIYKMHGYDLDAVV